MRNFLEIGAICAAVTMVGGVCYWLGNAHAADTLARVQPKEGEKGVAGLECESRLKTTVARLEQRLQVLELRQFGSAADQRTEVAAPSSASVAPIDIEAVFEEAREKESETTAAIDQALEAEVRDRSWATSTEEQLNNAVRDAVNEGAQFSLKTVRCLTSICELVLSAAKPEQLRNSVFQISHRFSGMSGFNVRQPVTAADGTSDVTFRLFREGYPPPAE